MDNTEKFLNICLGLCVFAMIGVAYIHQDEYETFMLNCKHGPECIDIWEMEKTK